MNRLTFLVLATAFLTGCWQSNRPEDVRKRGHEALAAGDYESALQESASNKR